MADDNNNDVYLAFISKDCQDVGYTTDIVKLKEEKEID